MKILLRCAVVPLFLWAAFPVLSQEAPALPKPDKEHAWLKQFEGEWETEAEAKGPAGESFKCKGTMRSEMLGGFWVVNETKANMMGMEVKGIQTLGYDSAKKKYVGTWVDNCTNHLWKYEGAVDASGKRIDLDADGPNMQEPGKMARFRDSYEFKSPDHIVVTSSMQGSDGKWITFMSGHIRRKKGDRK